MSDSNLVVVSGGVAGDAIAARLRAVLAQPVAAAAHAPEGPVAAPARIDAVLALDAAALAAARAAGVRVRVAVTRGLAARFEGGVEDATHVALPHAAAGARAGRKAVLVVGLASTDVPATAAPAPGTLAPLSSDARAAARQAAGLPADAHVVVVDALELRDVGLRAVLTQLALAEPSPAVMFDVGEDVAVTDALRAELPGHPLDAFVFAGGGRVAQLPLADLALGRASGLHLERALVSELPVLPLPPEDAADELALAVLAACGGARPPRTLAVLSVALDAALLAPPVVVRELDAAGMPDRLVRATRDAVTEVRAGRGPRAAGLPVGLERIGSRDDVPASAPTPGGAPPTPGAGPPAPSRDGGDVDARIDAELAALKKRL